MKTSLLLLLASATVVRAVQPQEVVYDSYADFALGTTRSTALSDLGVLAASPALDAFAAFGPEEAAQIWAIVPDAGNAWYAATSPKGTVFRVAPGGKAEAVAKFPESHVYALAKSAKGDLFAATSPDGKVYKVNRDNGGKFDVWFEPKEKYIWALAFDKKGNLFAATGTNGRIYKITGKGQGAVFFDSDETHLRSLAFDGAGNLLAGSADSGLLYRIAPDGSAVVLAATGRQEVNRIAVADDGTIWFSAAGAPHRKPAASGDDAAKGSAGLATLLGAATNSPAVVVLLPKPTAEGGQLGEGNSSSQVWRIDASLSPQPVWSTPDTILSLDLDASGGPGVRVGTGGDGYVYRLDGKGRATRLLKLDGPAVTAMAPAPGGGTVVASSNPARLYRVGAPGSGAGVYESDVIDSHGFARWGAVHAEGPDAKFALSTRSGNTPEPDASWYPWSPLRDGLSVAPSARYFQYKVEVQAGGVDHVDLSYLPKNVAPKIDELVVLAPGLGYLPVTAPPPPAAAKTADQIVQGATGTATATVRYQPVSQRGYRTAAWKASDPNGDALRYTLYSRAAGDKEWRVLAKDQSETVFSWDASSWPDGRYYLKVVATDAPDNLAAAALTDEAVSRLFLVDNTAPAIRVASKGRKVEFTVSDDASGIDNVSVSTDGNEFKALVPADGVVDPRSQRFAFELKEGEVLYIRAEDQAGNVGGTLVKP